MRGWLWVLRRYGLRRTWSYWCRGRRQGWMTAEEADVWLTEILKAASKQDGEDSEAAKGTGI